MKIRDITAPARSTLHTAPIGSVVRLRNGKLYLIAALDDAQPPHYWVNPVRVRLLVNLETGRTYKVKPVGHDANGCTIVDNAELVLS